MDIFVYILIALSVILCVTLLIIIIRTLRFRTSGAENRNQCQVSFDSELATECLKELIKCRTVSNSDRSKEENTEFKKFTELLPSLYPEVYKSCEVIYPSDRSILIRWRGRTENPPAVLMAHYDVVPVNEDLWDKPPFDAIIEDGELWGRGTLDTKVTVNAILFSANHLIKEGFVPERDIYFAFSGSEEVMGDGAKLIVDYFVDKGLTPSFVLDEGGAVVSGVFPGVKGRCGLIGIAEKGFIDLEYKVKSGGGHASAPKPNSPVVRLSNACLKLENKPFKHHITRPVSKMFDTLGRHSTFLYRMIFANLWCFGWILNLICKKQGGELNALMRTTVAFTMMNGSNASNVIPPKASLVSNIRLNPYDTVESATSYIKSTIDDKEVELNIIRSVDPSIISRTDTEGYDLISGAITSTWDSTIVSPYLMVQCSDSRHWGRISDAVYRFSAMELSCEERALIHGNNERIPLDTISKSCEFYIRLIKKC